MTDTNISKDLALYLHTRNRMRERYGVRLNRAGYQDLCQSVASRIKPGKKLTCRKFVTHALWGDKKIYLIWDRKRQAVVTVLTKEMYLRLRRIR